MFFLIPLCSALTCKNIVGSDIDTWAAFKIPTSIANSSETDTLGIYYFYRDDQTPLARAPGDVDSTSSNPIYHSLSPMWSHDSNIGYALLNDQPPDKEVSTSYAHLKGVIVFDKDCGLYLTHSVPHFPPDPATAPYSYPSSGRVYGQSFECFTFALSQLELISQDLLVERPYVYASNFPSYADSQIPSLKKVIAGEYDKTAESNITTLKTRNGLKITHFAKSKAWGKELYHDLVAPTLKGNIYSETWANGVGTLPSDCSGSYEAHNILTVNFGTLEWKRTQDHSKWAVVDQTVCIGDINRQSGQFKRGGGTFCRTDATFGKEMNKVIGTVEQCES
jgi:deoxyribonuclease-2